MNIEQIYTGCLAQGAYYIFSDGEIAIIDPLREIAPYIKRAEKDGGTIKYIFETHFHADFVSGHVTLSKKTGAKIVYGPTAKAAFDTYIAQDEEIFELGKIKIKVLHTPGHTMESTTYLLFDETGKEHAIFSGDTLFLGDVGRPDLAQKAVKMTQEELAGLLYESLRKKIMPLPDDVIVYPGHGAGSACGKQMMTETVDTLGNQKKMNYALRADMTKEEFIKEVTEGLLPPPNYFPLNVKLNKEGYEDIDTVLEKSTKKLSPKEFESTANASEAIILDVRDKEKFAKEHIPNSIFIGLDGGFAPWVGELIIDIKQPLLLIVESENEEEVITRLSRVGFDNTLGILDGGIEAWKKTGKETATVAQIKATELKEKYETIKENILDVRKKEEFLSEHIKGAKNIPLSVLSEHTSGFDDDKTLYIHCAGGYRSLIASSILKSRGIHNLVNIEGGFDVIKETAIPKTEYVCPSTITL